MDGLVAENPARAPPPTFTATVGFRFGIGCRRLRSNESAAARKSGQKARRSMSKVKGSCLCGGVRYESAAEPLMTAVCHCENCQRQSGTAFSIIVGVPAGSL